MKIKRIIFIEDDILDFEIFKTSLSRAGNSFKIYHETDVTAEFYNKYDPRECLVFLDLRLGIKNGREVFVNNLKDQGYVTFILSSSDDPNDIKKCQNIGLAGYLQKKDSLDLVYAQIMSTVEFVSFNLLY